MLYLQINRRVRPIDCDRGIFQQWRELITCRIKYDGVCWVDTQVYLAGIYNLKL